MDGLDAKTLPAEFYKSLLDQLFDAVYTVDAEGVITYWNESARRLTGYAADQMLGQQYRRTAFASGDEGDEGHAEHDGGIAIALKAGMPGTWKGYVQRQNGQRIPIQSHIAPLHKEQDRIAGAVVVFRDASALVALEDAHRQVIEMSRKDQLTGLFNRAAITALLKAEIDRARRYHQDLSLIMMDIDHFKRINDNYGHEAGDRVLAKIGDILQHNVRGPDVVGRWGGEEFLIVTPNVPAAAGGELAQRLRGYIKDMTCKDVDEVITASFGVSQLCQEQQGLDGLVRAGDASLYRAKESGRDRVVIDESN